MTHHIFFSWQSDTPPKVGRNLIESSLERAIGKLRADADVDPADRDMAVDRDTRDVPGLPPILETILGKIDGAALFVSDLTYVAQREGGGRTPNPNVCIEHGYALKALSWRRLIAVMNTAFGHPDQHELPFDLRHARRPIMFECASDADNEARRRAREELTAGFVQALRSIFDDEAARAALRPAAPAEPHPHDVELLEKVRRQLSLGLRRFLGQHSFGTPYPLAVLDPLHEMTEDWVGAAYEFHDEVLQASFVNVRTRAAELGRLVLERIYPMDGNSTMGSPKTGVDRAQGIQPSTLDAIRAMDGKASELSDAIDDFDRLARDRVRVASAVHARAEQPKAPDEREAAAAALLGELAFDASRGTLPEIVSQPRATLRLAPFAATEGRRLDAALVARAQLRFPPLPTARVATDADGRQWWSCAPPQRVTGKPNPETRWQMRLVRPGALEYQATIGHRVDDDLEILVDGRRLEALIVRTLERMAAIAAELGLDGPALVQVGLDGVEDVMLTRARPGGRRMRTPEISLPVTRIAELTTPVGSALREQLDILWQAAGWADGSSSYPDNKWLGYSADAGYELE
jgi:hypothetical protein